MKTNDFEKFIKDEGSNLYSFSYVLIPDDLQASQLMIDGLQSLMIEKKNLIEKWITHDSTHIAKMHLYKAVYEISKKRFHQLESSFKDLVSDQYFFSLEFDEKSILYLKERTTYNLEEIGFITGKSQSELHGYLASARSKMFEFAPELKSFKNQMNSEERAH